MAGDATILSVRHAVRLGTKFHIPPDVAVDMPPPEFSVVVRRVAVDRFWSRL